MGRSRGAAVDADEIAEFWIGPCGANVVHVRPDARMTIPPAPRAAGPLNLPDYLAHRNGGAPYLDLAGIEALRTNPGKLATCSDT